MVDQIRQNRLRLMAKRQGLMIRVSRQDDPEALHFHGHMLCDASGNSVVRGDSSELGATVNEIEERLKSLARRKSSDPPTKPRRMPLGQVSKPTAGLVAQETRQKSKAPIGEVDGSQQDAAAPKLRTSRPLAAELAPMQPWPMRRLRTVGVSGLVMLILAATVLGFSIMFPAFWQREATDGTVDFAMSLQPVQSASVQPSGAPIPRLVLDQTRGITGEPVPLGLTMQGWADGAIVIITGLVPGTTLSTGNALGANVWQVPATDLANTWVGPPTDFVGRMDLIAELHLADATVIHRQPIEIEWVATSPAVAAQVPAVTSIPEAIPAPQQLEQDETAMKASKNPTARTEQHGGRTHQKRKASARRRAPDAPAYVDQQHDVRQSSQPTQTRDGQDSGRVFIDAQGNVEFILPMRRSEPDEDIPAVASDAPSRDPLVSAPQRTTHAKKAPRRASEPLRAGNAKHR